MSKARVSVIMNCFNSRTYLDEAIESLLQQSYQCWEMIFWDNCSDDDSVAIAKSYKDSRIRVFTAPHRMTLAAGRNEAVARSTGEWIAFLDCDDIWDVRKLEQQLQLAESDPEPETLGGVYARVRSFSARGDEGESIFRYEGRPLPEGRILKQLLMEGNLILPVAALIRKSVWDEIGGIPSHYRFAEDYHLFCAIAERYRLGCVQETLCYYRVHSGSATANMKWVAHIEGLKVLQYFQSQLTRQEYIRRVRVYETLIGLEELLSEGRPFQGITRLFTRGSCAFLLRGACSRAYRRFIQGRRPTS